MKQEEFNKLLEKSRFPKEINIILKAIENRLISLEMKISELEKERGE